MAVYINDTVNTDTDCETPIPKVCGRQKVHMPTASCDTIHFTGVDDAEINQGQDFDPTEGVHAYDGNGEEIPFTVEPSEVDKCQVGEIELEYTATGVGKKLLPKLCGSPNLKLPYCGVERKRLKRNLVIKGIAPPSIRGIERVCLDRETLFNPMDGVSAVDGNGNTLEVSHSGTYDEVASGEIASFESIGGNSKSLKIELEPIQDLHGYDKPWSGGAGKNKFDVDAWIALDRNSNFYSVSNDVVSVIANDASGIANRCVQLAPNTEYTISFTNASSGRVFDDAAETLVQFSAQTSATFTTTASGQVAIKFYGTTYPTVIGKVQIEEGSTATAWTPYENICPISGHTEVNTQRTGKNLFSGEYDVMYKLPSPILKGTWITVSAKTNGLPQIFYYDENGEQIDYYTLNITDPNDVSRKYRTFEVSRYAQKNAYYVKISTAVASDIQIEISSDGAVPSVYEEPQTYTTSLGQTVYGGTLDVVSGELVVDRAKVTLDGTHPIRWEDWRHFDNDTSAWLYGQDVFPTANSNDITCDKLATVEYVEIYSGNVGISRVQTSTSYSFGVRVPVGGLTTVSAINAYLTESPIEVVYPLATPQTIQLTPQEVQLLLGTNNVWSDGMVTVAYPVNIPDGAYNYPLDGAYEITYHAEDRCGNETTEVRQVIVSKSNSVCGARVCCATVAC